VDAFERESHRYSDVPFGELEGLTKNAGHSSRMLSQDRTMLAAQLWWWFAFFPGSSSGLANGDHKPGLLTG
jgi:hypothetical protein